MVAYQDHVHFGSLLVPEWAANYQTPDRLLTFPFPKNNGDLRQLALLSVRDLAMSYGVAGFIASKTDPMLSRCVYSARLASQPPTWQFRQKPFRRFRRDALKNVKKWACHGMVRTDISSYYPTIPVERLLRQLWDAGCNRQSVSRLIDMIMWWQDHDGVAGLPIGPEAMGIPGTFYLHPLDAVLGRTTTAFFRYTDDVIYLFGSDGHCLDQVDETLHALDLRRSDDKTNIYYDRDQAVEAVARQQFEYLSEYLTYGPPDGIERVREMFDCEVVEADEPDIQTYRWALPVFMNRSDPYAVRVVAQNWNLFDLDPRLSADYMERCGRTDRTAVESLLQRLLVDTTAPHNAASRLHALRVLSGIASGEVEGRLFQGIALDDAELSPVRAWAWSAYARSSHYDLNEVLEAAIAETDPHARRGAILTLRHCKSRGRKWAARCFEQKFPAEWCAPRWAAA